MKHDYKKLSDYFTKHKYVVVRNFLSKKEIKLIYDYCNNKVRRKLYIDKFVKYEKKEFKQFVDSLEGEFTDSQVPGAYSCYGDAMMDALLEQSLEKMCMITGLDLIPNYTYWRMYKHKNDLKRHKDRLSCEISTTITLGYEHNLPKKYCWPIYVEPNPSMGGLDKKTGKYISDMTKGVKCELEPGDMLVYRGCVLEHWREQYIGKQHAQVFLHYNDKNGPIGDSLINDTRPALGLPGEFKKPEKTKEVENILYSLNSSEYNPEYKSKK